MNLDSRTSELASKHGANWKTISGAKVLVGKGGKIIAGAGGKFANLADMENKGATATNGGSFAFTDKSSMEFWVGADKTNEMASLVNGAGLGELWGNHANEVSMIGDEKGRGYYDPYNKAIVFDRSKITVGNKESYQSVIHEMSHAIDYRIGDKQNPNAYGYENFSYRYKDGAFDKAIRADVDARMKTRQAEMKVRLKELAKQHKDPKELTIKLAEEGFIASKDLAKTQAKIEQGKLPPINADAVGRSISKDLAAQGSAIRTVSDIYGGATANKVFGGYGHGAAYWKRDKTNLTSEAFASMSASKACSKAQYEAIKEYFPTAHKVYEEMVADMAKL